MRRQTCRSAECYCALGHRQRRTADDALVTVVLVRFDDIADGETVDMSGEAGRRGIIELQRAAGAGERDRLRVRAAELQQGAATIVAPPEPVTALVMSNEPLDTTIVPLLISEVFVIVSLPLNVRVPPPNSISCRCPNRSPPCRCRRPTD